LRKNEKCIWQRKFESLSFYGTVENKFIDSSQHSTPIIEVKSIKSNLIDTLEFYGDMSDSFTLINKLDTIYKSKKSDKILLKRNGKFNVISRVNFGCD
jgi:hypothetical protein